MVKDLFLRRLELFRPDLEFVPGEVQIVRAIDRYQVQVSMWYFQTHDGQTAAITGKGFFYRLGDGPGEYQYLVKIIIGQIEKFVDLELGHDKGMSFPQRKDIQESKEPMVFGDLISGDLSCNDLGKDGHTVMFSILN